MTLMITQMMHGGMWAWMLLWALVALAILVLAVTATIRLVRRGRTSEPQPGTESAQEMLRRRYANGEIDEDEYLKRRSGLDM